jgi:hypothetical protein
MVGRILGTRLQTEDGGGHASLTFEVQDLRGNAGVAGLLPAAVAGAKNMDAGFGLFKAI